MTQELVAGALGVRREGITEAAGNLQRAGIVRYRRGHIAVLEAARTGGGRLRVLRRRQRRSLTALSVGRPIPPDARLARRSRTRCAQALTYYRRAA